MTQQFDTYNAASVAALTTPVLGRVQGGSDDEMTTTQTPEEVAAFLGDLAGNPVTIRRFTLAGTELVGLICPCADNRVNNLAIRTSTEPHVLFFVRTSSAVEDAEQLIEMMTRNDGQPGVMVKDGTFSTNARLAGTSLQFQVLAIVQHDNA